MEYRKEIPCQPNKRRGVWRIYRKGSSEVHAFLDKGRYYRRCSATEEE